MTNNQSNSERLNIDRGFTLIELLVVVAIIGVLSGVVLASLSGARDDAREAAVMQSLNEARTQSELYLNQNGSYDGFCGSDAVQQIVGSLESNSDGVACEDSSTLTFEDGETLPVNDFGVSAAIDDLRYSASPQGVGVFREPVSKRSRYNPSFNGSNHWSVACEASDGVSPTIASLQSTFNAADIPEGMNQSFYWSSIDMLNENRAFYARVDNQPGSRPKDSNLYEYCIFYN